MNQRIPRAFFSCSLQGEDYQYNSFVETIIRNAGFEPFGTVCKFTFSPQPIPISMREELQKADCLIVAATPRYFQKNLHNNNNSTYAMSEIIHTEIGMAYMRNIPILVFKSPYVNIGNFLPSITQYIDPVIYQNNQYGFDIKIINNYFQNTYNNIIQNWEKEQNEKIVEGVKIGLGIIGGLTVLNFFFNNDN